MILRQIRVPNGHDLRTLIHAFETFLGLRNCFDGRNPKALCAGSIQRDADALPAVFDANDVPGKFAAIAKWLFARVDLKKTIVGIRARKLITDSMPMAMVWWRVFGRHSSAGL